MRAPELIVYREPETDRWVPGDRYPRRIVRSLVRGKPITGYRRCLQSLKAGLSRLGVPFEFNSDRAIARNPDQSVGLLGKRDALASWRWPNPIVCGPLMLDHPKDQPDLFERFNAKLYLVAGPWMKAMFEPYFGDRVRVWPVGVDSDLWRDFSAEAKTTDVLLYIKFMWDADRKEVEVLGPILDELKRRGLSWESIRAGSYSEQEYLAKLRRSRAMIFLSEHETQGLAYLEALSCNVPVLAWDQGWWLDPKAKLYESKPVPASSVPYFSPECGLTFSTVSQFSPALDQFLSGCYQPRDYVVRNFGLAEAAQNYLRLLERA
jgi:hypothetical protein